MDGSMVCHQQDPLRYGCVGSTWAVRSCPSYLFENPLGKTLSSAERIRPAFARNDRAEHAAARGRALAAFGGVNGTDNSGGKTSREECAGSGDVSGKKTPGMT
jgi:hypothetical protein